MAHSIRNALYPRKFRELRIGVETAIAFKRSPFFQLVGNKTLGFRNKFEQRQVEILVLHHIEISAGLHFCPIYLDVSDTAMWIESEHVLSKQEHRGIGNSIFSMSFYNELTGTENLLIGLI